MDETEVDLPGLTVAAGTQAGHRYDANYDVLHLSPDRLLVVVADGMGSGPGPATAGRVGVSRFVAGVRGAPVSAAGLRAAVADAQVRVRAEGAALGQLTGCTLTALVAAAEPGSAWIVQLGDSRAYRLRDGLLELLTVDHTTAWLGAVYGWFAPDSPAARSARYQLSRYLGHPDEPEPDLLNVSLRSGDVLCVCTDGLAEEVSYQRLAAVLGGAAQPRDAVRDLLADALAAGGRDNATVAVVRVD